VRSARVLLHSSTIDEQKLLLFFYSLTGLPGFGGDQTPRSIGEECRGTIDHASSTFSGEIFVAVG